MTRVQDALNIILDSVRPVNHEKIRLETALGRVLAEDIISDSNIPAFDNSAMDGYALRSCDTKGASQNTPKILEVIADLKAGDLPRKIIKENQAVRIMTGAPIPKGADSVVMVENTQKMLAGEPVNGLAGERVSGLERVKIFKETESGENIRKAGEDIKKGELVIQKGTLLNAGHIGLLASLGKAKVKAARKPKVAILATGDELMDIDKKPAKGKLRSSNTYTLYAQVLDAGASPKNLGIAKDKPQELEQKIKKGLDCDVILTSGGVSVGDYDLVKDILAKLGTNIKFWKVAMRPGKPLVFGTIRNKLIFGLPGNPVSSMISFECFVRPAILKMLGQSQAGNEVEAVLEEDIEKKKGLIYFLRANTWWNGGFYAAKTTGPQGSGILKSMAAANSLIILDEDKEKLEKGSRVRVRFLN